MIDTIVIAFKMKGISIRPANAIILHFTMEYSEKRHREEEEEENKQEPNKTKETIQFEWATIDTYEKCKYKWVIYGIAH